jgi:hypothetical protein
MGEKSGIYIRIRMTGDSYCLTEYKKSRQEKENKGLRRFIKILLVINMCVQNAIDYESILI